MSVQFETIFLCLTNHGFVSELTVDKLNKIKKIVDIINKYNLRDRLGINRRIIAKSASNKLIEYWYDGNNEYNSTFGKILQDFREANSQINLPSLEEYILYPNIYTPKYSIKFNEPPKLQPPKPQPPKSQPQQTGSGDRNKGKGGGGLADSGLANPVEGVPTPTPVKINQASDDDTNKGGKQGRSAGNGQGGQRPQGGGGQGGAPVGGDGNGNGQTRNRGKGKKGKNGRGRGGRGGGRGGGGP